MTCVLDEHIYPFAVDRSEPRRTSIHDSRVRLEVRTPAGQAAIYKEANESQLDILRYTCTYFYILTHTNFTFKCTIYLHLHRPRRKFLPLHTLRLHKTRSNNRNPSNSNRNNISLVQSQHIPMQNTSQRRRVDLVDRSPQTCRSSSHDEVYGYVGCVFWDVFVEAV